VGKFKEMVQPFQMVVFKNSVLPYRKHRTQRRLENKMQVFPAIRNFELLIDISPQKSGFNLRVVHEGFIDEK
jgi:hypothetical protein